MGAVAVANGRATVGHEILDIRGTWVCRRCGKQSANEDERRALKSSPCGGSAGGRAMAHATGNVNYIWKVHTLATEGMAQQGARLVRRSHVPSEMVDTARFAEMEGEYADTLRKDLRAAEGAVGETEQEGRAAGVGYEALGASEGRWVLPWEEDPQWMYLPHLQGERQEKAVDTERGSGSIGEAVRLAGGHRLRVTGPLVRCTRCACFALHRHGQGLKRACNPKQGRAARVRLDRLHQGRHPITRKVIEAKLNTVRQIGR